MLFICVSLVVVVVFFFFFVLVRMEPRCEKTGLRGFRPGPTQTRLHRRWLED